jgi:O-acetyl-ADP-ribose deacetylase (regulator of RNase III)
MSENKYAGKKCFVIMPFGKRKDVDGIEIDFNHVYQNLIKEAVESLGMECERCDEIIDTGSIHLKMFHGIFEADLAVVDITALNPNVFYELGVRHALNKHVTLVIRRSVPQPPPFNINGLNVVSYEIDTEEKLEASRKVIREYVQTAMDKLSVDSLVHLALDNLKVERKPRPIDKKEVYLYPLVNAPGKEIGIITGDIQNIKNVDVWVNSENTNMKMARHYERSVSGAIRYLGARKDIARRVKEDLVADELYKIVGQCAVDPGTVIPTGAGELTNTNGVKKIFHAAAVKGQVGRGYSPISDVDECVRNALELADSDVMVNEDIHSILFPLMGTGTSKQDADAAARDLISAAISYLEENKKSKINKVFFLAFNEQDRERCEHVYSLFIKEKRLEEGKLIPDA